MTENKWADKAGSPKAVTASQELTGDALLNAARKVLKDDPYEKSHEARREIAGMRNADMKDGRKF